MTERLPSVLSAIDLPIAELYAARLDGELFGVGAGFAPIDEIEEPRHRLRALHVGLSARLIAEQFSAAWVWGATQDPPIRQQVCVTVGARVNHTVARWISLREVVIEEREIATIDGLRLTTPIRTTIDLARFSPTFGAAERAIVHRLAVVGGFDLDMCTEDLAGRRNLPNRRQAAERLASCLPFAA